MKYSRHIYFTLSLSLICLVFSCKQNTYNKYAYDLNKDTIAPVLALSVPVSLDTYSYGEDIHMVGTATDLESKSKNSMKAGKLKSLYLNISIIDPMPDTVLKVLFTKYPVVDGKNGYTINEKTFLAFGSGTTYCRFTGILTDYADRRDTSIVNFTIN